MAPLNTLQGIKATGTVVIADTADFNVRMQLVPETAESRR